MTSEQPLPFPISIGVFQFKSKNYTKILNEGRKIFLRHSVTQENLASLRISLLKRHMKLYQSALRRAQVVSCSIKMKQ